MSGLQRPSRSEAAASAAAAAAAGVDAGVDDDIAYSPVQLKTACRVRQLVVNLAWTQPLGQPLSSALVCQPHSGSVAAAVSVHPRLAPPAAAEGEVRPQLNLVIKVTSLIRSPHN